MGTEKAKKRSKTVKVSLKTSSSAKEGGAFNPAIEDASNAKSTAETSPDDEGVHFPMYNNDLNNDDSSVIYMFICLILCRVVRFRAERSRFQWRFARIPRRVEE